MEETRYGKLGRLDALIINQIIGLLYSDETSKIKYKKSFLNEFNDYLDRGKKKGEPVNEGCVW